MTLNATIKRWKDDSNNHLAMESHYALKKAGNGIVHKIRQASKEMEDAHAKNYAESKIHYREKVTIAGDMVRVKTYPLTITIGESSARSNYVKANEGEKVPKSLYRARENLVDTINANRTPNTKFMTLTTAEAILDRSEFMKKWKQLQKNYFRRFGKTLRYVAITERQKKRGLKEGNAGAWHIHAMLFHDEFIPREELEKCWPYGIVDIRAVANDGLHRYMAKYLQKDMVEVGLNEKAVVKSRGLKRPETRYNPFPGSEATAMFIERSNARQTFEKTYFDEDTGEITMTLTEYIIPQDAKSGKRF